MAIFGLVPDFVRASIRLGGFDPARGARAAAALLARTDTPASRVAHDPHLAAWRAAYRQVGLPEDVEPPPAVLAAWATLPGGIPSQGALADLVHAFSLQRRVPIAAYDIRRIQGDLWLRPSRGCEHYLAIGSDQPISPPLGEIILVDSGEEVFARAWHGRQGRPAVVTPTSDEVLVHVDLLPPLAAQAAALAEALVRLLTGFLGGEADLCWLTWDTPEATWPPPPPAA